jgi:hypothetical protein
MFEKIWRSLVKWFRKSFGLQIGRKREMAAIEALPPLDDVDREYLFMQLLEGVAHGWQQPRAIGFFNKIRHRVRKSDWLEWLDRFGNNLLDSPAPNYELAGRMVQLGQLDCGDIGDKAAEYGSRLLNFHQEELPMDLLPIIEFDSPIGEYFDDEDGFDEEAIETGYLDLSNNGQTRSGEAPSELLVEPPPMPESSSSSAEGEDPAMETREITLEEFAEMLAKDPTLVAELAVQFGVETTDPQVIVNAVMAQMQTQQEIETISRDLSPEAPPLAQQPSPPPPPVEPPVTMGLQAPSMTPAPPASTDRQHPAPPPPPSRRLEYNSGEDNSLPPKSPDRGV